MLRMTSTTTNMVNVLAILSLVNEIGPLSGEIYSNIRLCEFFSNEATRERLKLCQKGGNIQVARVRRDVNRTQQSSISPTITTTKRGSHAYTCRRPPTAPNGFPHCCDGVELIVKWTRDKDMWSADITWEMPKPKAGRANCTGYVIQWDDSDESAACDYVTEEDATSYSISSRKRWISTCKGLEELCIAVFPLPFSTPNGQTQYRCFEPPKCQDPKDKTTANASPVTTTVVTPSTAESKTVESTVMNSANKTKTGPSSSTRTSGPVVTKLVFAIVISSIAVVIVAILFLLLKRKRVCLRKPPNIKETNGAAHYISYNASNKREAMDIARWLQNKNVNVVIDKFSLIIPNRRVWSETKLLEAEKIIMIITPQYLEICTSRQSRSYKQNDFSCGDELVNNEISLIRNKLIDLDSDKIVIILVDTKEKDLPHWMSGLHCYQYKNGKLNEEVLRVLKPSTLSSCV